MNDVTVDPSVVVHDKVALQAAVVAFDAGNAAYKQGEWEVSLEMATKALAHCEGFVPAMFLKARSLVQLAQWLPARQAFAQGLRVDQKNYSAWLEAGHLCRQMGLLDQAAMSYQCAIHVDSRRYEAFLAIARVLALKGDLDTAERAYGDAVKVAQAQGHDAVRVVHQQMGEYWLEMGQAERASQCLACALTVLRDTASLMNGELALNLAADIEMDWALVMLRLGRRDKAVQMLTAASAATSESVLTRLATMSFKNNYWQEAIEISRRCVALHPKSAWARWGLAHMLTECWQMDEAEEVLQQAESMAPMPGAQAMRAAMAGKSGDAEKTLTLYLKLAKSEGADSTYASSAAMSSLYTDVLNAKQVATLHRSLFESWGKGARGRSTFVRAPLEARRLRLGVVTADFHHQHPVNIFMQPIMRELDRSKFELVIYFVGDAHDEQTALARSRAEHWVEAGALNDAQLAKRIDTDSIDVLMDMAGHTVHHRMRMFAQRAAPVQVTYLGYAGSTGVPNMDYILGDDVVTPVGSEKLYSEEVVRLPGTVFCYAPEDNYPLPKFGVATTKRPLTFGSFNNVSKLTPRTLKLWAKVLKAVPDSRLVLKAPSFCDEAAKRVFTLRLKALGIDMNRVEFRGPVSLADMMAEYADIDVALDPLPYNGGTTSLQAMWMGVPVVTMLGDHFVSRMGASFMTAAGMQDWVAMNDAEYVAIAKRAAADRVALLAFKKGMRKRLQTNPAWDVVKQTRAIEAVLLKIA